MELKKFSKLVKEVIRKNISAEIAEFIKELPIGKTNYKFMFELNGKSVRILSPLRSLPTIFEFAKRIIPQKDYTYSARILNENKTNTLSKTSPAGIPVEKTKENLLAGENVQRIFYETLKTEDFKITYSEQEGTIIAFNDADSSRRFFQILVGLFPFAEVKKENEKIKIDCSVSIEDYSEFRKKHQKRGTIICSIEIDDEKIGTKTGVFIF